MQGIDSLTRFDAYATLLPREIEALMPLVQEQCSFKKGALLQQQGDRSVTLYLLLQGWTASTMAVASGERQMLKVHMCGDLIGLPSLPISEAADSVIALTDVAACVVSLHAIGQLFEDSPRLAALLFLISQEERLLLMDRLTTVGRVEADGRLACFLLQTADRLRRLDPNVTDVLNIPLTQKDYSDLVGINEAHLSRVIRRWREEGLIKWQRNQITILNEGRLRDLAAIPRRRLVKEQSWLPVSRRS